jgi:hypothetical protein
VSLDELPRARAPGIDVTASTYLRRNAFAAAVWGLFGRMEWLLRQRDEWSVVFFLLPELVDEELELLVGGHALGGRVEHAGWLRRASRSPAAFFELDAAMAGARVVGAGFLGRKRSPIPRMRGRIRSMPARISRRRVRMRRNRARVTRMRVAIAPFRAAFDGIGGSPRASRPPLQASRPSLRAIRPPLRVMDIPLHEMGAPLRTMGTPLHEMGAPLRAIRPPLRAMDTPLHEMGAPLRAMASLKCPMLARIRSVDSRIGSMRARVKRTLERAAFPDPAPGDSPRRSSNEAE